MASKGKKPTIRIDHDRFTDACKHIQVSKYGINIPYTGDLFTDSARPGETRYECKRRLHAEQQTMARGDYRVNPETLTLEPTAKSLKPRTKREKALVAQSERRGWQEGYDVGRQKGECSGRREERERGEKLMLRAIAAATGKHTDCTD